MTDLRTELVQIAAVAMAAIEDLDTGSASRDALARVMTDVALERMAQNRQWGPQHHDPIVWLAILAEEVGEVARTMDVGDGIDTYVGGVALVSLLAQAEEVARHMLATVTGGSS